MESDKAKILTENAENPSDIDSAEANQQLQDIKRIIDGFNGTEEELTELNKKLKLAEARVEAS